MSLRKAFAVLAFGAAFTVGNALMAQQAQPVQAQPRQPAQAGQVQQQGFQGQPQAVQGRIGQAGQQAQWQNADHVIASCLAIDNQLEVALAKWVQDQSDNDDVDHLAKMMIDDHQEMLQKLAKWAPDAGDSSFLTSEKSEQGTQTRQQDRQSQPNQQRGQQQNQTGNAQANNNQQQPATGASVNQNRSQTAGQQFNSQQTQQTAGTHAQGGQGAMHHGQIVQIHREIAQECLSSAKDNLGDKKDKDFAKCFVGSQIVKHQEMLDKLTVFQRHVSPELAQVLADGSSAVKEHLDHAQQIMDKLEGKSSSTAKKEKRDEKRD